MDYIKLLLGIALVLVALVFFRFSQWQKCYIVVEIHVSRIDEFEGFLEREIEGERKAYVDPLMIDNFYRVRPRFLAHCLDCERYVISETIAAWARAQRFNEGMFDVGPVSFHDGAPVSVTYPRHATRP